MSDSETNPTESLTVEEFRSALLHAEAELAGLAAAAEPDAERVAYAESLSIIPDAADLPALSNRAAFDALRQDEIRFDVTASAFREAVEASERAKAVLAQASTAEVHFRTLLAKAKRWRILLVLVLAAILILLLW